MPFKYFLLLCSWTVFAHESRALKNEQSAALQKLISAVDDDAFSRLKPASPQRSLSETLANITKTLKAPVDRCAKDLIENPEMTQKIRNTCLTKLSENWIPTALISFDDAKRTFETHCASCHGQAGSGYGPLAKKLDKHPMVDFTDPKVTDIVSAHMIEHAVFYGKAQTPMPGFKDILSKDEIWGVSLYLHSLSQELLQPSQEKPGNLLASPESGIPPAILRRLTLEDLVLWNNIQTRAELSKISPSYAETLPFLRKVWIFSGAFMRTPRTGAL